MRLAEPEKWRAMFGDRQHGRSTLASKAARTLLPHFGQRRASSKWQIGGNLDATNR